MVKSKMFRVVLGLSGCLLLASPADAVNIVVNGDFEDVCTADAPHSVPAGWIRTTEGGPDAPVISCVADNGPSAAGTQAVNWIRVTTSTDGRQMYFFQALKAFAIDNPQLSLDVKVISHNLEAGGTVTPAFEWPVRVRITYSLASDPNQTQVWIHGFYIDPPGDGTRVVDPGSGIIAEYEDTLVTAGVWSTHTFDLTAELPDLGTITEISIGGGGHAFEGQVDNVVLEVDTCDLACYAGCLTCDATDAGCSGAVTSDAAIEEEDNFVPKMELALVQTGNKINHFQQAVLDILAKLNPPPQVVEIASVQDAIDAINAAFIPGPPPVTVNVVIFGHGAPGIFKIGKDDLADPAIQDKFLTAVTGQMASLTLYGCEVSQGAAGQAFLKKLTAALKIKVKTWTTRVYAFGNDALIPAGMQNKFFVTSLDDKKEIPTVSEWGLAVMALMVLAAGTIVMTRRRRVLA